MKQSVVTAYVFNAAAKTVDLSSISSFDVKKLYAIINIDRNQIIYAAGIPAFGLASVSGSIITLVFNTTAMSNTDRLTILYDVDSSLVTSGQGVAASLSGKWPVQVTDGTNTMPTMDVVGRAGFQKVTDGSNVAAVKPASTAAASTDPAAVVALSPNSSLPTGTNNVGSITNITGTVTLPTGAATSANQTNGSQQAQMVDATGRVVTIKAASTASVATDTSAVVALSPNSPVPAGANNIGSITNVTGTVSLPSGASTSANQTNGTQKSQTVDGSGNVQPSGDVAARAMFVKPTDGTNSVTVKAASTAAVATDTAEVVALSPNSPLPTGSNNVGSITNVTGTVSLPTGASTSANQTNGSQKTQAVDGGGSVVGPVVTIAGTNYLPVSQASSATPGAAVPARSTMVAGSDGTNAQTLATDTSGDLKVVGSVASGAADSGNPVKIGGKFNTTQPTLTNGNRGDIQLSVFGDIVTAENTKYQNINTATTTTVKSGAGLLYKIQVNNAVNNATITIYDNTTGTGTKIGTITQSVGGGTYSPVGTFDYGGVNFNTGLTIVTSSTTDITVIYK